MIDEQLLNKIVPLGSLLKPSSTGFDGSFTGDFSRGVSFSVTDAEINQLHPHLSIALRTIALDDLVVSQKAVMNVLTLWDCGIYLIHKYGTPIAVYDAEDYHIEDGILYVEGLSRTYGEIALRGGPQSIKLPDTKSYTRAEINTEYLNQNYPDWASRLNIAKDLGVAPSEALRSALASVLVSSQVVLPGDLCSND